MVQQKTGINKQSNIPRHLRNCHAPVLLDRASDFSIQRFGESSLNTSSFCGVEVPPTNGDIFSILIWTSLGD
jgi:hypothetical protein